MSRRLPPCSEHGKGGSLKGSRTSEPALPAGQSTPQPQNGADGECTASVPARQKHRVGQRELLAINLPHWADSSSPEPSLSDASEPHHKDCISGNNRDNKTLPDPPLTPSKNNNLQHSEVTPRTERALRRDLLRQRSESTNETNESNESDLDCDSSEDSFDMSSQQGKWREEQVLVICPGSQTTMAQLGCNELTVPAHRIPTRMFKTDDSNEYRPYHTYKRKKSQLKPSGDNSKNGTEDEWEYVEDRDSVEGAIYPIEAGRIVNMRAFLAFIDHVHSLLTATYHNTPIVLMASPQWTRLNCETIARYVFEKTKTPALCLLHSAVAAQYGVKWPNLTVVDIGYQKVDVTCIYDSNIVSHKQLGYPAPMRDISGGEIFTQKLLDLLKDKGFNYDMAEQLKRSPICEVLGYASDLSDLMEVPSETQSAPSQAVQVTASVEAPKIVEPTKPATATDGNAENDYKESDEGVLDVANIVTSGNTREFLARREKEKAEKMKVKKQGKGQEPEPAAPKPVRLPNSKRMANTFHYEELVHEDVQVPVPTGAAQPDVVPSTTDDAQVNESPAAMKTVPTSEAAKSEAKTVEGNQASNGSRTEPVKTLTERRTKRVRKDIEVGPERLLFADRGEISRITDTIYRAIQSIDDMYKRSACWDNILFVGNGSRLRGLKENIMQTLLARYLISPSTATIFTSELPSNMATPSGTGSQTPTGSFTGQIPTTSSVNPLLQAATTASLGVPGQVHAPGSHAGESTSHHFHGQTPMSIKLAALPTYLTDWTKNGFEEAMFLGSLVAARLAYCIHNFDASTTEAQRYMSLNRVDYNEFGPKAIRIHSMLG